MAVGIAVNKETGGSAVGSSNPLPVYTPPGYGVQLSDGTKFVDIASSGTADDVGDGIILLGRDTDGTFYPVPLTAGGGTVVTPAGSGSSWGTFVGLLAGTETIGTVVALGSTQGTVMQLLDGTATIGTVVALGSTTGTLMQLMAGTEAVGTVTVASYPTLPSGTNTIGTVIQGNNPAISGTVAISGIPAVTGTVVSTLNSGGTVAVSMPAISGTVALSGTSPVSGTVVSTLNNGGTVAVSLPTGTVIVNNLVGLNAGTNTIGTVIASVSAGTLSQLMAGTNVVGTVIVSSITAGSTYQLNQLIPQSYDNGTLTYTGSDIESVVYKSGTNTLATLTLGYSGGSLVTFART